MISLRFSVVVALGFALVACGSDDGGTTTGDVGGQEDVSQELVPLDAADEDMEEEIAGRQDLLPRDIVEEDLVATDLGGQDMSGDLPADDLLPVDLVPGDMVDLIPQDMEEEEVADLAPEDLVPEDMAGDVGGPGACNNSADINAFATGDTESLMKDCAMSCIGKDSSCGAQCAQQKLGLSGPCSMCVGDLLSCTMSKCMFPCMGGGDPCQDCIAEKCGSAFADCAGIEMP